MLGGLCGLLAAGAVGCGSGERLDANEEDATYDVTVVDAEFPAMQRLADQNDLAITVRNDDSKTIPDVAITLKGLERRMDNPNYQDPNRSVFMVNSKPVDVGGNKDIKLDAPGGGKTALVDTWTLGKLEPGKEKTFRWRLTAVKAGPYELSYAVSAGLGGKAKAVGPGDAQPRGEFKGTITSRPTASRIADDNDTVVKPAP